MQATAVTSITIVAIWGDANREHSSKSRRLVTAQVETETDPSFPCESEA